VNQPAAVRGDSFRGEKRVEVGDHAQPAVLKNRSRKLGAGTARVI
jgi:hypothetical protein